jgi:hypothetical protein
MEQVQDIIPNIECLKNNITYAVNKSISSTLKYANICEISGKTYDDDDDSDGLYVFQLDGAIIINPHHCYGQIQYHKDYKKYIIDANIYFECLKKIILYHNFQDLKDINVYRSNGSIQKAFIKKDTPLEYYDKHNCLCIKTYWDEDNDIKEKSMALIDIFSSTLNKNIPGLISTNKDFFDNFELKIKIKSGLNLFVQDRVNWKVYIKEILDKTNIKYSFIHE